MPAQRRRFTDEEKLEILNQASHHGISKVLRQHNLSYSVFHRWKEKLGGQGRDGSALVSHQVSNRLKDLLEENSLLKKIIANQAMLLELKEEELRSRKI
ncbi:MAG TPA: transposase [Puia sp.]|nr:transposase [Puia sp.]